MMNKINQSVLIIGTGIFFYLATASFAYLFKDSLRIIILNIGGFHPLVIKLSIEAVYVLTHIAGIFALFKLLKSQKIRFEQLFFTMVILLAVGQILQFIVPYISSNFHTGNYWSNSSGYYEFLNSDYLYYTLDAVFEYLMYVILGVIIYKNRNLILKLDSEIIEINDIGK